VAAAAPLILMTGATGFVGRQVLGALVERNCRVRLVVREGTTDRIAHREWIESVISTSDLWAETSDWWAAASRDVDTVIHVAWYAEPGQYLQSPENVECLAGTLRRDRHLL